MILEGHEAAWRTWRGSLSQGRMHHGWLLAGRRGLGKASFAAAAARELVGGAIADPRAHPDILFVEPLAENEDEERKRAEGKPFKAKRNISVDQVRAIQRRLNTRPTLGERRAVIVDAADDLEKGAVNALLKSLEEPPAGTVFLLVAHRPGRLPATIRSRCRVLRFAELDESEVVRVLGQVAPDTPVKDREATAAVAAGSPGTALDFLHREFAPALALMARIVREGDAEFALRGALLGELGQRPDRDQQLAALEAARMTVLAAAPSAQPERAARIIEAHAALARLLAQASTANFDPATLVLEIGGLLASVGTDREAA